MSKMFEFIKRNKFSRKVYFTLRSVNDFFKFKPILYFKQIIWFFKSIHTLNKIENKNFSKFEYYPCLSDNISYTPLDPTYFFQDSWAARKIFELKTEHHFDIGSSATTIGILSQFVPITMIDIRPIKLEIPNLYFIEGSILDLPFDNNSINSLSSLCVIEHIGLGRYGDPIDAFGSEKAIEEIKRVIKPGGVVIISLPIDNNNKVYFNAHRAFTREYVLNLFMNFSLMEEKYHYGNHLYDYYDKEKGFGTGLYMFRKLES